jgi:hypothetical protein
MSEVIHILVDQKYMHQLPETPQRKLPHHSSILSHILSSYYDNRYVSTCLRLVYEASEMVLGSFGMFSMEGTQVQPVGALMLVQVRENINRIRVRSPKTVVRLVEILEKQELSIE